MKSHPDNLKHGDMLLVTIHTTGDAFHNDPSVELARLLRALAQQIDNGNAWLTGDTLDRSLTDSNGNTCGRATLRFVSLS